MLADKNYSKSSLNILQNDLSKMDKSELIQLYVNLQTRLNKVEDANIDLRAQLLSTTEERDTIKREALTEIDLQQIQEQIKQKDLRIDEMNNLVLAKERQIIDLQEMCNEQGQVAQSKSLAVHIVNRRLQELDAKQLHDVATETIDLVDNIGLNSNSIGTIRQNRSRSPHRFSPGRAIPQLRLGGTPPPVDPAEDGCSSYTTETQQQNFDGTIRKKRKKVNFNIDNKNYDDFSPPQIKSPVKKQQNFPPSDYEELLIENDHLRQIIREMEEALQVANKISNKPESQTVLKVKAVAQAKIRELEGMLSQKGTNKEEEIAELKAIIDQLKESREWVLGENSKLQDQLEAAKQKCSDLVEEMDSSLKTTDLFRKKLDDNVRKMDGTIAELYQTRAQVRQVIDEKAILTSEIERLKEAIFAQDEFIGVLEGDLLVYEAHVGILRDSIGASKKEDRQYIKSKAFSAKINALEAEKEEISRKNNEEKLRAKAFSVKIRCLEQERDELKSALRQYESNQQQVSSRSSCNFAQPIQQELCAVSTMTNDDFDQNNISIKQLYEQLSEKTEHCETLLLQISDQKQQNQGLILQQKNILNCLNELTVFVLKFNGSNTDNDIFCAEDDSDDFENIDLSIIFFLKFEKIKNAFELINNSFESIKQSNETLVGQIEIGKEESNSLKLKFEQQEETKLNIEWELKSLWQKYTETINLVENGNKKVKELEEQIATLLYELESKKCQILELETENRVLEEEKTSLKHDIHSIEQLVGSLRRENAASQNKITDLNAKSSVLSTKLNEERNKLEKLVNLLNSIVAKFKSNVFAINEKSLDEFINEGIIENSKEEFEDNQDKINQIDNFQKNILQLEDEITNLKIQLAAAEAYAEDLLNQNSTLLLEKETLLAECNNLLHFKDELFDSKTENIKLFAELKSLEEVLKNERKIVLTDVDNKQVCVDLQTQLTQTEFIEMTNQCMQTVNVAMPLIDAQVQCEYNNTEMKSIQIETDEEQKRICFSDVAVGDNKVSDDFVVSTFNDVELEKQKKLQQQSHQLLKECIQDRQEFERDMDINVQQLFELKTSLEISVEILKGEVWALNAEIKRRFAEQNSLKSNLEQVDNLVTKLRSENDKLISELSEKNKKLDVLMNKIEYCEANEKMMKEKNESLSVLIELEVNKNTKLQNLLILFSDKNFKEVHLLRDQLQQLKEAQIVANNLVLDNNSSFFKKLVECSKQLRKHKCGNYYLHDCTTKLAILAANLTIKNVDNDALVRENNELIMTNAKLQNELDQMFSTCPNFNSTEDIGNNEEKVVQIEIELKNDKDCNNISNSIINTFEKHSVKFGIVLPLNNVNDENEEKKRVNKEAKSVEDLWNWDEKEETNEKLNQDLIIEADNIWEFNEEKQIEDDKKEENIWSWRDEEKDDDKIEENENVEIEQKIEKQEEDNWAWNDDDDDTDQKSSDNVTLENDKKPSTSFNQKNVSTIEQKNVKSLFDNWGDF